MQVVQVEEMEVQVLLLVLLEHLQLMQAAAGGLGIQEAQDPEVQEDLEAGEMADLAVAQRKEQQILVVVLEVMDLQLEAA
jgi:hypothetical protein